MILEDTNLGKLYFVSNIDFKGTGQNATEQKFNFNSFAIFREP